MLMMSRCAAAPNKQRHLSPAQAGTNKHDKSPPSSSSWTSNVTIDKITTTTTTTCCQEPRKQACNMHANHTPDHCGYHNYRLVAGGHHAGRRHRPSAGSYDDWRWPSAGMCVTRPASRSALSSPCSSSVMLAGSLASKSNLIDEAALVGKRAGCSLARSSHSIGAPKLAMRIISPALLLLASVLLAHFYCQSTLILTAQAAPSGELQPLADEIGASATTLAPLDTESWRSKGESMRDQRDARLGDKLNVNVSNVFEVILKKRPYSRYWTVEQKWDDLFRRLMAVQGTVRQLMMKNFLRDIEYYADLAISPQCEKDLKYIQNYGKQSSNLRWLTHMFDSTGKSEPGMLTGMLAHMGHPVQCIKVRAPAAASNHTFDERFFEEQTRQLGERFRGKYCLASIRPVMPEKPHLVSRFSVLMNSSLLSNLSYTGESLQALKMRARQMAVPARDHQLVDRQHLRLDQVPFESELYEYLIAQRNFMFTLPRFMGVCYPSSCTRDDIRSSLQKTMDDQHQVVDIEFECEQEEVSAWDWFLTPRLVSHVLLRLVAGAIFLVSFTRYILLSKMQIRRSKLDPASPMVSLLNTLDMFSMDKCAGILFIKTRRASPIVDWSRVENNRSTSIDALRGFLVLVLVYSQMALLGCLPLPFMWSKWSDAMFPFFRSLLTQLFINTSIWSEAFYIISAYLISLKCFENFRPRSLTSGAPAHSRMPLPNVLSFVLKRYVRLVMPMLAFILLNYVWPRLSNGFVFQDQTNRLMRPCDTSGWTNMMLFHNHYAANETCLWPSHVSATFFQLHLLSYPLLALCLMSLWVQFSEQYDNEGKLLRRRKLLMMLLTWLCFGSLAAIGLLAAVYAAWQASSEQLIVPFLIDYIDYDNYQRVIEWMVTPTYNHLTSYVVGIALAFIVVRRKAKKEQHLLETSAWFGSTSAAEREDSVSSVRSSSTQELQEGGLTFKSQTSLGKFHIVSSPSSICASSQRDELDEEDAKIDVNLTPQTECAYWLWRVVNSSCAIVVLLASLLASWFWNGLGQPMSAEQTFWYVLASKVLFSLSFAYLFHEHFATRRNSSNPWMVTRFLVPIGRMSLSVFYVSWLVIWFDLLSSLHQWHPSHYFLLEKYNEVIFITLIVAMFVYGAFEGIIKRVQYANRLKRVKQDQQAAAESSGQLGGAKDSAQLGKRFCQPPMTSNQLPSRVKPFESFFDALDKATVLASGDEQQAATKRRKSLAADGQVRTSNAMTIHTIDNSQRRSAGDADWQEQQLQQRGTRLAADGSEAQLPSGGGGVLSPSDRYKLNAELRANYSFASIGLYENAGATGDLSNLNTAAHDPQASPAMSQKR